MTRHIADKPHASGPGRLRNFIRQDRESGLHPAVAALHARARKSGDADNRRLAEYARIERGQRA